MAEDVTGRVEGKNGERLEVRVGGQAFGLTTRDLIPILLLILIGISGYLRIRAVEMHLNKIDTHHLDLSKQRYEQDRYIDTQVEKLRTLIHEHNEKLAEQTQQIRVMLTGLDYNIGRKIEERIPLELVPLLRERGKPLGFPSDHPDAPFAPR